MECKPVALRDIKPLGFFLADKDDVGRFSLYRLLANGRAEPYVLSGESRELKPQERSYLFFKGMQVIPVHISWGT